MRVVDGVRTHPRYLTHQACAAQTSDETQSSAEVLPRRSVLGLVSSGQLSHSKEPRSDLNMPRGQGMQRPCTRRDGDIYSVPDVPGLHKHSVMDADPSSVVLLLAGHALHTEVAASLLEEE